MIIIGLAVAAGVVAAVVTWRLLRRLDRNATERAEEELLRRGR